MYEGSELKRANDAELDSALQQHSALRAETLQQLATVQATVTPFWWGLWIMLRVRQPALHALLRFCTSLAASLQAPCVHHAAGTRLQSCLLGRTVDGRLLSDLLPRHCSPENIQLPRPCEPG